MRSPCSRTRPFKKSSSIRNVKPTTAAPRVRTSRAAAVAVPPVANTSSTINTRSSPVTASVCISSASVPYSSAYSTRPRSAGSFPGFRIGTSPALSPSAIGAPSRKPRDSMDTTREMRASRNGAVMSSTARRNAVGSSNNGVMSLNTIPGLGKSGTSRMWRGRYPPPPPPPAVPPDVHGRDKGQRRQDDEHRPPGVGLGLLVQDGDDDVLLAPDEPPDPGEHRAPHQRPQTGERDELHQVHTGDTCGDRDEVPDHREHASHEGADLAVLGKVPLRALEALFGDPYVLADAAHHRAPQPVGETVVGERTGDASHHAAGDRQHEAQLALRGEIPRRGHHQLARQRQKRGFDGHQDHDPRIPEVAKPVQQPVDEALKHRSRALRRGERSGPRPTESAACRRRPAPRGGGC